jgi:chromosome partitioning protein
MDTQKGPVTVISIFANKGGEGKTHIAMLLANCLGAAGKKVLVIDLDENNSSSSYYLSSEEQVVEINTKNIANVMNQNLTIPEAAIQSRFPGVSYVAASRGMSDLRSINEKRLKQIIAEDPGDNKFIIIDCHPSYDNISLNAMIASDVVLTPVFQDTDSFNAALFLSKKLRVETTATFEKWYILVNGYNRLYENASGGRQRQYLGLYMEDDDNFPNKIPSRAWLPWTSSMKVIRDERKLLSAAPTPGAVCNTKLHSAICNLAEMFLDDDEKLIRPEVF